MDGFVTALHRSEEARPLQGWQLSRHLLAEKLGHQWKTKAAAEGPILPVKRYHHSQRHETVASREPLGRVRAEVNSHDFDLSSVGSGAFQAAVQGLHQRLFETDPKAAAAGAQPR